MATFKYRMIVLTAVIFLTAYSAFGQEKTVYRTVAVPDSLAADSLKPHLSAKVDEGKVRKNWKKLKKGMSSKEVELLLGSPTKIASHMEDNSTTYYYGKRQVIFDITKEAVRYWETR